METNIKIVIIEDNPMITLVLKKLLTKSGYQVLESFIKPQDFLDNLDQCYADIVISDLDLSTSIDGLDAAELLRELLNIPVLFYSDCIDKDTILSCISLKNTKFVSKTSPLTNVLSALEEIVEENFSYHLEAI